MNLKRSNDVNYIKQTLKQNCRKKLYHFIVTAIDKNDYKPKILLHSFKKY